MSVLVFGSINVDHVAYVDRHPVVGETVFGEYQQFPGGKGANQAIAAARAGEKVSILGAIGSDPGGEFMKGILESERVITTGVNTVNEPTGVALIVVSSDSNNSIAVCPGANNLAIRPSSNLPSSSGPLICLSQGETPQSEVIGFFKSAKEVGGTTVLNPAPYKNIEQDFLKIIDYLILNEIEFAQHFGLKLPPSSTNEVEEFLGNLDAGNYIVTLGPSGVVSKLDGRTAITPAPTVDSIDTVGAGDCFCGNFAARLSAGDTPFDAIEFAVRAASISVTRKGAASSMPTKDEVMNV